MPNLENPGQCIECGDGFTGEEEEIIVLSDGESAHRACAWFCEHCADPHTNSAPSTDVRDEAWCEDCRDSDARYCDVCLNYYHSDRVDYIESTNVWACNDCVDAHYWFCGECDALFERGSECECDPDCSCSEHDGDPRLRVVDGRDCGCESVVHGYSCKPELEFHGVDDYGLFMGFELETQIRSRTKAIHEAAVYATELLKVGNLGQLKSDSSIRSDGWNGFEIVTQPHSFSEYRDNSSALWEVIESLRKDYRARSWDTSTCGLHIHVGRDGFDSGAHQHRFIAFFYHNAREIIKFAGRKSHDYAPWNDIWIWDDFEQPTFNVKEKVRLNMRSAVNCRNRDTIELRFFRGTMNPAGVLAALGLAHAAVEFTRGMSVDPDVKEGLDWVKFTEYVSPKGDEYPGLLERMHVIPLITIEEINDPPTLEA